jgi:hypothetical protein
MDNKTANNLLAREALVHITQLKHDTHFAWFMQQVVALVKEEEQNALDVTLPSTTRDTHAQRRDALKQVENLIRDKESAFRGMLPESA